MDSTAGDVDSNSGGAAGTSLPSNVHTTLALGTFGDQQPDEPESRTLVFGSYGGETKHSKARSDVAGDALESTDGGAAATAGAEINREETPAPSDELRNLSRALPMDTEDNASSQQPLIGDNGEETNDEESLRRLVWSLRARVDYLEEQDGDPLLPEDTYTFFATTYYFDPDHACCRPRWAFVIAVGVFLLQGFALSLLATDVIDVGDRCIFVSDGANFALRASQLVAILITVLSQDLITASLTVLTGGYDRKAQVGHCGFESLLKWHISVFARLLMGLLSLTVTFLLIMKSNTVRDLLLNFAAVSFISHVDKIVFQLAAWGYASSVVQDETGTVKEMRATDLDTTSWKVCWMILLALVLVPFWVWLSIRQGRGDCRTSTVLVQFGDDFSPALATFSGVYSYRPPSINFSGDRGSYELDDPIDEFDGSARFVYCEERSVWNFQYGDTPTSLTSDTCNKGRTRSSITASYDILSMSFRPWYYKDPSNGRVLPLQHFSMEAPTAFVGMKCKNECSGKNFVCLEAICACDDGWFGTQCQFKSPPCRMMKTDERFGGFDGSRAFGSSYTVLYDEDDRLVQSYGRPVYRSNNDIMIFTGRRWQLTSAADLGIVYNEDIASNVDIADFIKTKFHGYWSDYNVSFVSDPADSASPTDLPSPVGFRWHHAGPVSDGVQGPDATRNDLSVMLLCAVCNDSDNPCYNGGVCDDSGVCRCVNGTSGTLCQVTES